jgi:addiction module RelB/DinJ family antitoxin
MKDAVIRARIDARLKADAIAVLADCGLELSDAIRLFLKQVVARRGLPFPINAEPRAPVQAAASVHDRPQDPFLIRRDELAGARIKWPDARLDE